MNDIKIKIPGGASKIINILENRGYEAYIVGGCMRDSILGRDPNDWDICTSATPDEMMYVFQNNHIIGTGLQHGTLTIVMDGDPYNRKRVSRRKRYCRLTKIIRSENYEKTNKKICV